MEEEKETFEQALTDVLTNNLMDDFDLQLREKIASIIKEKDPKALRVFIRNLYKNLCN